MQYNNATKHLIREAKRSSSVKYAKAGYGDLMIQAREPVLVKMTVSEFNTRAQRSFYEL